MPKTIDDLVECCFQNTLPPIPVIADYFGMENFMKNDLNELCIIFGLYIKMIVCWNIHKDVIENAFLNNHLDELVHDTYSKHGKTGCYKQFCIFCKNQFKKPFLCIYYMTKQKNYLQLKTMIQI